MKSVVIFGSTGNTGLCAVEAAIKRALKVRAFVRDPNKMPEGLRSKVEIVQGDVLNEGDVKKALEGQDAAVVVLGTRNDLSPTTMMSEGTKIIINQMKQQNIKYMSACLSAFLFYEPEKVPAIFKELNSDHQRMLDCIKASDLQWIAVLPPHIADEPATDNYIVKHDVSGGRAISKHDLGDFLVKCLTMPEHYQKVCGIGKPVPAQ
ncbi:flavin reductase (NADPH) [Ischnura elegans]|uniref:flavin reductase (NADPH) n=1 Tax=Ischnura elegans TaxID=197161 RepID=UPI001ED8885E|nr:flavin reductase (NADPH) [Ischnura elegans]